ncbi:hypothetical protein GWN26_01440 [Candidatus Saccharibacteria bacterium]|nr:hypothetical protein [Candidatus Saccharibacteria bacterium]NIV03232.1 hypothetical protein [Calditrichia bacterium]NIS37745.1 hypothetical protein [Candidatus Saccharibacteria bacterium]NIV71353.1 hypothetical protein [Calditrichia bacterium]NIV97869.1 hypothetical protein [Candidatus Saccharibacteria bacterium]
MNENKAEPRFDTHTCPHCINQYRYPEEVTACQCDEPHMIAQKGSQVRLSLPDIVGLHNRIGTITRAEGPVEDKRYDGYGVMTFRFTVELEGDEVNLYSDQFVPADQPATEASVVKKLGPGRMIGQSSPEPGSFNEPSNESAANPGPEEVDEDEEFAVIVIDDD